MKPIYLILIAIGFAVIGQMFMKHGMSGYQLGSITIINFIPQFLRIIFRPFVFIGFVLYMVSSFFWLIGIAKVPLSYAYPMISISYVLVVLLSWLIFKEQVGPLKWLGVAVIIFGVYLISRS